MKIVFVLLALLCSLTLGASAADPLASRCLGRIRSAEAPSDASVTLHDLGIATTARISCMAFEVNSTTSGSNPSADQCLVPHQTEYPYLFSLVAEHVDGSGREVFDMRDVAGGSIGDVTMFASKPSHLSVVFTNLSPNSTCTLTIRAIMTVTLSSNTATVTMPSLVAADPPTIFASNTNEMHLIFRYPTQELAENSAGESLFAARGSCKSSASFFIEKSSTLPENITLSESNKNLYVAGRFSVLPGQVGLFVLCHVSSTDFARTALAEINIFDGNPTYYEFVQGLDNDGHIYGYVPLVIKFHGYNLDTRPGGDSAKLVLDEYSCQDGEPAGGVPMATDLGPEDDYGPLTTYTLWTFSIKYSGVYRVCYHRKSGSGWTEVPSIDEVGPGGVPAQPEDVHVPIPTNRVSKEECPVMPDANNTKLLKYYAGVRMVLNSKAVPKDTRHLIADVLCVPRSAVSVEGVTKNKAGNAILILSIDCEGIAEDNVAPVCNSAERYGYLKYLSTTNSTALSSVGVSEWEVVSGILIGDTTVSSGGNGGTFFICITIVGVAVGLAYAKVKYDERREYFVQFGMDDGDLEDMYETGAIPFSMGGESEDMYGYPYESANTESSGRPGGRGGNRGGGGRPASHIGDALIEIEE